MQYCVYAHALSCTEHMSRKRIWSLKWQTKTKKKKLAIYRAWPWISNCWEWDSNSGLSGIESSALTTRPSRLGANLRRDATSGLLFLNQSVLADFDPRKKKEPHFKTRSLSGTSNNMVFKIYQLSCQDIGPVKLQSDASSDWNWSEMTANYHEHLQHDKQFIW